MHNGYKESRYYKDFEGLPTFIFKAKNCPFDLTIYSFDLCKLRKIYKKELEATTNNQKEN